MNFIKLKFRNCEQWIGELPFWSSQNVYSSKLKKQSTLRMVRSELKITMNDNNSFGESKAFMLLAGKNKWESPLSDLFDSHP